MLPEMSQPNARMPVMGNGPQYLRKLQKAAIIVRLLRAEGVEISLADLPDELQVALTEAMSAMRYIDRNTLRIVVAEFVAELDDLGLAFPHDLTGTLDVLDGTISEATAARLRMQAGLGQSKDPWVRIAALDSARLVPVLEEESIEIAAVILSMLKVAKSAELLGLLPGERARRITYAISRTGEVSPATVARIGDSLVRQFDAQAPKAFENGAVERVGAILNFSAASTRDDVLEGLETEDEEFATEVRKAIFTFTNVPERIDPRDIPKITREVDAAVLITALAACKGKAEETKACDFVLENMSQRMAAQMRDEMEALGTVKDVDGEAAMNTIVSAIRDLEEKGELLLVAEDA